MSMGNSLQIISSDDPRLYKPARQVSLEEIESEKVQDLIEGMFEIMRSTGAVGVAATQLGVDLSIAVYGYKFRSELPQHPEISNTVLINPVFKPLTDVLEDAHEGCLSIPNLRGLVSRNRDIACRFLDGHGKEHKKSFHSLEARIVQHECDHLAGVLFLARVNDFATLQFMSK